MVVALPWEIKGSSHCSRFSSTTPFSLDSVGWELGDRSSDVGSVTGRPLSIEGVNSATRGDGEEVRIAD